MFDFIAGNDAACQDSSRITDTRNLRVGLMNDGCLNTPSDMTRILPGFRGSLRLGRFSPVAFINHGRLRVGGIQSIVRSFEISIRAGHSTDEVM